MSLLNVGARALLANQVALQTAGHNIANVSTPGYSRQNVVLETVQGQFTGGGYIGKGVDVATILRNHSELLTRQSAAARVLGCRDCPYRPGGAQPGAHAHRRNRRPHARRLRTPGRNPEHSAL